MLIWNSETTQKPKHLSSPNRNSYFSSYKALKSNHAMQLFKFFHTENTSNFKTQTAKIGGFCEELLSENDFEAVLVNFCCYQYGTNASEAVQKVSRAVVGGILQFFSKPPTKTDAPHGVVPSLKNEVPPPHLKNNFLLSILKRQVDSSPNFVSLFSFMNDNSSVLFSSKQYIICSKGAHESENV